MLLNVFINPKQPWNFPGLFGVVDGKNKMELLNTQRYLTQSFSRPVSLSIKAGSWLNS